jgi:hypothetical protein
MIANGLRPYYEAQAKERQQGGQGGVLLVEKIPQAKARDEAGKAAGVFNLTSTKGDGNLLNRSRRTPRPPRPTKR